MDGVDPTKRERLKSILLLGLGGALALALLIQTASNVLHRSQPAFSLQINSSNAAALEERAFDVFQASTADPSDLAKAAGTALPLARSALESEPLSPKALAISAIALESDKERARLLNAAQRLNRRDRTLQALILQSSLTQNDLDAVIDAFDRIMRTYPRGQEQFFPILAEALESAESATQLVRILESDAPWRDDFFSYAVERPETLENLARLRKDLGVENRTLNKRLISGLADSGALPEASAIYREVTGSDIVRSLGWGTEYPPFDWRLIDLPGLRAQPSLGTNSIDVLVRPGENGPVAWRLLDGGSRPASYRIGSDLQGPLAGQNLRLQARCADVANERPLLGEVDITGPLQTLRITQMVQECRIIELMLRGRVERGRSALRATLQPIEVLEAR